MATQGVVSILRGGRVIMKIVVGCNGYTAEKLAGALEKLPAPTVADAIRLSDDFDFGCRICRVVVAELPGGSPEIHTVGDFNGDGNFDLYRETFALPEFNPRCERGDGAVTRLVRYA